MLIVSSEKIKFTSECERILKECLINESGPGTILHDFDFLFNFLKARDCPLTATHQLPLGLLPEINSRLSHPVEQGLRRPQQRSYPHINGLFLLVRASGLTFVEETSKKPLLSFDNAAFMKWKTLNHTERYCSLLETWFLRGKPEIIGESDGWFFVPNNFYNCVCFFEKIPEKGLPVAGNKAAECSLRFEPGWHNLGLLELFGLISVRHGLRVDGKAWNIEHICRTRFGDALIAVLITEFFGNLERIYTVEDQREAPCGVLQPILQSYFKDWRNNLPAPEPIFREGTHIFNVTIGRFRCRIAIPADQTLDELAFVILDAVDFDDDHLYRFSYRNRFGVLSHINHPYLEDGGSWTNEVLVGDLPLRVGQKMTYLFDFGHEWEFEVILEQVDPNMNIAEPEILEQDGKAPEQFSNSDE